MNAVTHVPGDDIARLEPCGKQQSSDRIAGGIVDEYSIPFVPQTDKAGLVGSDEIALDLITGSRFTDADTETEVPRDDVPAADGVKVTGDCFNETEGGPSLNSIPE